MQTIKRIRKRRVTSMLAAAVLFGLATAAGNVSAEEGGAPTAAVGPTSIESLLATPDLDPVLRLQLDLFTAINRKRAEAGLAPLQLDARLMASAAEHSTDMAAGGRCRHNGRDGSTSRTRMRRHGYPFNNWAGENIICSRRTVDAALTWWLRSAPHRRNILHGHFTHIGIGIDPNGPYGPMWTLNFAAGAPDTVPPAFLAGPQQVPADAQPAPPPADAQPAPPASEAPPDPSAPPAPGSP